jgi:hypothetical protein
MWVTTRVSNGAARGRAGVHDARRTVHRVVARVRARGGCCGAHVGLKLQADHLQAAALREVGGEFEF